MPQEVSLSPQPRKVSAPDGLTNGSKTPAQGEFSIEELRKSLRPQTAVKNAADNPIAKRKWVKVTAIGAGPILILSVLAIWLFRPGTPSKMNASVEPGLTATQGTRADSNTQKPSPSTSSIPNVSTTPVQTGQTQVSPSTEAANGETSPTVQPTRVQSKMMDEQLAAPIRISRDIHKPGVENEPPPSAGLGTTEALGGGNTIGSVFTGSRPVVRIAPAAATTVSAGVAVGLLIQKTAPVYPSIARDAHVSGTVQIEATISKAGSVKDIRVVSGPPMLRQAAVDAVQTWRYKPYKLNNEPTEVQTTINVVFSLHN
ncbi:MAG TPA: TonB family protein [Terracidiphilus sp.]|nr:TonB family protein [Terracidiphilus sp.]